MSDPADLQVELYQRRPIQIDASFHCATGEVLALVGPSGSGKSTILRAIAGLHALDRSRIRCHSQTWDDSEAGIRMPPQRRRVGLVFQQPALMPHLNALDNVAMPLRHLDACERDRQARDLLARVNLHGLAERYPAQLSGGQQQRVGVARALARDPSVLLLDEPFSAVDQVTRRKLRLEVTALMRDLSIPVVMVTHDLDEAELLADRMCVIHRGRSLQSGPPRELLRRPLTSQIARLVDVRNLFQADAVFDGEVTRLRWGGMELLCQQSVARDGPVAWMVPPVDVLLRRRDRPVGHGRVPNLLSARVLELQQIGSLTTALLAPDGFDSARLYMDLTSHVARRNGLAVGESIWISLPESAIHLMPAE